MLGKLPGIIFPWSFPPDHMHSLDENATPKYCKMFRGVFFPTIVGANQEDVEEALGEDEFEDAHGEEAESDASDSESDSDSAEGDEADDEADGDVRAAVVGRKRKRKHHSPIKATASLRTQKLVENKRAHGATGKTKKPDKKIDDAPKFRATDEPYNIPPEAWTELSSLIEESAQWFPTSFGARLFNFGKHCHQMTASQWHLFVTHLAPIYFKVLLEPDDYEEFVNYVNVVRGIKAHSHTEASLALLEHQILKFCTYWERRFYGGDWLRLSACLPSIHQLRHFPSAIRWAGPTEGYGQPAGERLNGHTARTAKSRTSANVNIANIALKDAHEHHLEYVIKLRTADVETSDSDEEDPRREALDAQFAALLVTIRPPSDTARTVLDIDPLDLPEGAVAGDVILGIEGYNPNAPDTREWILTDLTRRKYRSIFGKGPRKALKKFLVANGAMNFAEKLPSGEDLEIQRWNTCIVTHPPEHKHAGPEFKFKVTGTNSDLKLKGAEFDDKRKKRSSTFCIYKAVESEDDQDDREDKFAAEIVFFFKVKATLPEEEEQEDGKLELAYVRHLQISADGPLSKLTGGLAAASGVIGAHWVIRCRDIVDLAGLVKSSGGGVYVVGREGALDLGLKLNYIS